MSHYGSGGRHQNDCVSVQGRQKVHAGAHTHSAFHCVRTQLFDYQPRVVFLSIGCGFFSPPWSHLPILLFDILAKSGVVPSLDIC